MKTIKNSIGPGLTIAYFAALFFVGTASAQILHVDSVTVDSVWNSDSSWYDGSGILQQRTSRDCKISFIPKGEGMARMFIAISIDSGKTWIPSQNPLIVLNNALASTFMTNQKATIMVRILGGDRPGVVFKMTARQAAPVIAGNPRTTIVDTFGQSINIVLNLKFVSATSTDGFCTLGMVYWDTLCDGTIDDSTTGVNALTWKWLTPLSSTQVKYVIARAKDKNGLWSAPETLTVVTWLYLVNGTWSGSFSLWHAGAFAPDTFTCVLTIDSAAGKYSLLRGRVIHGSSGSMTDSVKESGTYTKIGTDSLVLAPAAGACYFWDLDYAAWLKIDTTANSMFRTCPDPMHVKIDISGTTWNIAIPRSDDGSTITYLLKKR